MEQMRQISKTMRFNLVEFWNSNTASKNILSKPLLIDILLYYFGHVYTKTVILSLIFYHFCICKCR